MVDQHGQITVGYVNNVDNANDELMTQYLNEAMREGTEEVVIEVGHNAHLHPLESTAPAAQNSGRAPLQQPNMIIFMDQLMKKFG